MNEQRLIQQMAYASQRIMNASCMNAEIEAMKAENRQREHEGKSLAYTEDDFIRVMRDWEY